MKETIKKKRLPAIYVSLLNDWRNRELTAPTTAIKAAVMR